MAAPDLARGRWHTHDHHASVGSTNDLALAALDAGQPTGLVLTADRQTAGRGRRGRTWEDRPDGASLATSVTVPLPPRVPGLLPLAVGVAAVEALAGHDVVARLKWPNDVIVLDADGGHDKLAGILVEATGAAAVVGVGWNVDLRCAAPVTGATGAADVAGHDVDRFALFADHLERLGAWLDLLDDGRSELLLAAYVERCATLGRAVRVDLADGELVGTARAVGPDGSLVVEAPDGTRRSVTAGDVVHLRTV